MTDITVSPKTGKRYDVLNAYDRIDVEWQASKTIWDLTGSQRQWRITYHQQLEALPTLGLIIYPIT